METLLAQVRRARHGLLLQQFVGRLVVMLTITLSIAAVAIGLARLVHLSWVPPWWDGAWLGGAAFVGLLAAIVATGLRPRTDLDAASEIDDRYGLRERVASALELSPADRDTQAGQALLSDAVRAVSRIEIGEKFKLRGVRRAWWPLPPALIALLLMTLVGNRPAPAVAAATPTASPEAVQKSIEKARKELAKRAAEAEKKGLKDATDLLKQIEAGTRELEKKDPGDQKKAAVKLNDLAKELAQKKAEMGGREAVREQLNKMGDMGQGPASKVAQSLQKGDWKAAVKELEKLQSQLANQKLTPEQHEQLAKQLEKMAKQLGAAAQAQKEQTADLKRQIADAQRRGNLDQAAKLQEKLDQAQQKSGQAQAMQKLAQQLQKAQQAAKQGDGKQAAKQLEQLAQQLEQMQQDMEAMEMLDAAMTDIEMAKQSMNCKSCQGMGCQACQGNKPGEKPGRGMGAGRGEGPRPDEKNPTKFRDTQVKQNVGRGASTFGGLVEGPNIKGDVAQSIRQELSAENVTPADPLASERLPRSRRDHAEEYFKRIREEL